MFHINRFSIPNIFLKSNIKTLYKISFTHERVNTIAYNSLPKLENRKGGSNIQKPETVN